MPPPVRLVDAQGNVSEASPEWVQRQIADNTLEASGFRIATDADVKGYVDRKRSEQKPILQQAMEAYDATMQASYAGTIDAASAVARLPVQAAARMFGDKEDQKIAENLEGRKVMENLEYIANEAIGRGGEASSEAYRERVRKRAEEYPTAAFVGRVGGEIAGGLAGLGAGAELGWLGRAGLGLAEGAGLGGSQAAEDAYLKNHELTAEQWWAGVGLGGALGLGAELGVTGAGKALRAVRGGATAAEPPATAVLPEGANAYRKAVPEALEAMSERALGAEAAPGLGVALKETLKEGYVKSAAAVSGVDQSFIRAMGAQNLSREAREARSMLMRAPAIVETATRDATRGFDDLIRATNEVTEEVVQRRLKRAHVAANLAGIDDDLAVTSTRNFSRALRDDVDSLIVNYGKEGRRALDDYAKHVKKYDTTIQSGDAADAYMALDEIRRAMLMRQTSLRQGALQSTKPAAREAMLELSDAIQSRYLQTADFLMDDALWGAQGLAQRETNLAWVQYIRAKDAAFSGIATRQTTDLMGRPVYAADDAKIASHIQNLGRNAEGSLKERNLRDFIATTKQLTEAIGKGYDLPPDKMAALTRMRDAVLTVESQIDKADKTVRLVNQVDEMLKREQAGASQLMGAFGGGLVGGIPGAIAGAVGGAVARPTHTLMRLAQIEAVRGQIEKRFAARISKAVGVEPVATETFARQLPHVPLRQLGRGIVDVSRSAVSNEFIGPYGDMRAAYAKRVEDIQTLASNPYAMHARIQKAIGPVAEVAPGLAAHMTNKALAGVLFLASKAHPGTPANLMTPQLEAIYSRVPDSEVTKFARYWQAVNQPLTLFDELERGTLTHEHVEALQAVYPKLYDELKLTALDALARAKEPPPYETRRQLDLLLDLKGAAEPSASPTFQRVLALVAANQKQKQAQQRGPGRPMSPKIADRHQSVGSRIEAGAAS